MNNYKRILNGLYRGLVVLQTVLLTSLLVMVTIQIVTRLLPFLPYVLWTEEIARFLLVWVIFLGASIGVKEGTHFTVSLLPEPKTKIGNLIWDMGVNIAMFILVTIFIYRGYKYAKVMFYDISDVAQVSMIWVSAAIPVFGVLSLLFLIEAIILRVSKESL
ncbi:MAG: TRAP transporter small permease [Spirochaetaceae bacterium]